MQQPPAASAAAAATCGAAAAITQQPSDFLPLSELPGLQGPLPAQQQQAGTSLSHKLALAAWPRYQEALLQRLQNPAASSLPSSQQQQLLPLLSEQPVLTAAYGPSA